LEHFIEPDCRARKEVAVGERELEIDDEQHYAWVTVDCEALEIPTGFAEVQRIIVYFPLTY
jgi:hypothetical protein